MNVVLFDGDCHFCNASVQFILQHDKHAHFTFASLQSDFGQRMLRRYAIDQNSDSLVVIDKERAYIASAAVLRICRYLDGLYPLATVFTVIPLALRDKGYQIVARNRTKLMREQCTLPTATQRQRFIE